MKEIQEDVERSIHETSNEIKGILNGSEEEKSYIIDTLDPQLEFPNDKEITLNNVCNQIGEYF